MEFIFLTIEYCFIPFFIWLLIFGIKFINSYRKTDLRNEKIDEYGFEFVFLESITYVTLAIRLFSDACFHPHVYDYARYFSTLISIILFSYFIYNVLTHKSLKSKDAESYRKILYLFYWSVFVRIMLLFTLTKVLSFNQYNPYLLTLTITTILVLAYFLFTTIYVSVVDIYFITFSRVMSNKSNLILTNKIGRAQKILARFMTVMYYFHDEESHIAYCEAVRSYSDCCFIDGNKTSLLKAKEKLQTVLNSKYLNTFYDRQMFVKLLIAILCKLDLKDEAKNYALQVEELFQQDILNIIDSQNDPVIIYR